ncbi:hypothetical protein KSF_035630 [Reticulibacter mediterranei]|uniref:Uncharacterized protein n=1 Tax=Reticulibacter mediterranei TaxID=2778369 RepID=A0A8J3IJB7_9CHLR|nr:hypothetical protein [Reticulibacter mediterranei]GHO93515.1 hypothetical protein KSF_035630 [Reticulibacter mediterranei]
MMNAVREKVKQFLKEALGAKEVREEIRVIGIDNANGIWTAEAEVLERNLSLPQYQVFEKKRYIVKLTADLEVSSYKQVKKNGDREEE